MDKKIKAIIGALAVAVVVLAGFLFYILSQRTALKENVQVLTVDKQALTEQLTQLQQDYADLSSTNDTINTQLAVEKEKVAKLMSKLNSTNPADQPKLKRYEKEIGTLRAIMRSYIKQIDSLNQLNISLKQEAADARQEARESDSKFQNLKSTTDELSKQVEKGSAIHGSGLTAVALNGRGKETNRGSRVAQFKTCMTLVKNDIAQKGLMTVYIRVKDPEGILMVSGEQQVFTVGNEQLIYSASRDIDYQGEEVDLCIYFNTGSDLGSGTYTIEAYTVKGKIGVAEIYLK